MTALRPAAKGCVMVTHPDPRLLAKSMPRRSSTSKSLPVVPVFRFRGRLPPKHLGDRSMILYSRETPSLAFFVCWMAFRIREIGKMVRYHFLQLVVERASVTKEKLS